MNRLLITGGTGFFGRNMVRHILDSDGDFFCNSILVFSRDEHKQSSMRESLYHHPCKDRVEFILGDVRDLASITAATRHVDAVIHAAALKRIETCRYAPEELVKTNVNGALNLVEAAFVNNIKRVITLSTDKSMSPKSAYGYTKALADDIFHAANNRHGTNQTFSSVVYGNIFGSTGSVVPTWRRLAEQGDVPVTDPECTRFTIEVKTAIEIVLDTIKTMQKGKKIIVRGLSAYKLGDLVDAMGYRWRATGLPEWEKIHETMGDGETSEKAPRLTVQTLKEMLKRV